MAPTKPNKHAADDEAVADPSQKTKSGRVEKKASNDKKEKKTRDWSQYTHEPPTSAEISKNGRQNGRVLIKWNRPRMLEKLLLHMEYECMRARKPVPWASIAHRLSSSPAAVEQYLRRIRRDLMAEGHMVPPIPQKPGGPVQDPAIRGFVRRTMQDPMNLAMRPVLWTEPMEDRTSPASDAALAHDALDAEENSADDTMEPESTSLPSLNGKKVITTVPEGFDARTRQSSTNVSYAEGDVEDADDEAGQFEDGSTSQLSQISRGSSMTSSSKGRAHAHAGPAAVTTQSQGSGLNSHFGFVTPKRRGGNFTDAVSAELRDAILTTPTGNHFRFAPIVDNLPATGFEIQNAYLGNSGPTGFVPAGSRCFWTAASSPADFNPLNETPNTAAAMRAHLFDWNAIPFGPLAGTSNTMPSGAVNADPVDAVDPAMGLLTPEEPEADFDQGTVLNQDFDVPSMFDNI